MSSLQDFQSKSTEELIVAFQNKSSLKLVRESAFLALVYRFRQDVLHKCEVRCKQYGHSELVAEIITEATFRSYGKKGGFDPRKGKGESVDDSFRIYLYSIAKNELTNYYRLQEKKRNNQYYDGSERIITDLPEVNLKKLDIKAKIQYEIIKSLSPSLRTVHLTYLAYEKIGCNLPKGLQAQLRQHLGNVKQTTIRTYKKEAKDKIAEGLRIMETVLNSKR